MLGSEAARQIETSTVWPVGWLILVRPFQGRRDTSTVTRGYAARPRAIMSDRVAVGVRWTIFYQNICGVQMVGTTVYIFSTNGVVLHDAYRHRGHVYHADRFLRRRHVYHFDRFHHRRPNPHRMGFRFRN